MRRTVDADKLMDELGHLATDTDLCKRYGNCTPWIPYSAVRKLISDMILEAKESCDDAVNRQEAIDKIKKRLYETAFNNVGIKQDIDETLVDVAENRLESWLDELPSAQPDTTTHDSIPAKTGKNDVDKTSGDCISRQQAVDTLRKMQTYKLFAGDDMLLIDQAEAQTELMMLPSAEPETNCSEIPNNSDTISRQQAIDALKEKVFHNLSDEFYGAMQVLDELPPVQPERKTGRWIPDNTDYYRTKFICSACGESEEVPTTGFGYGTMWDYCPMCGAKMEGGEQE